MVFSRSARKRLISSELRSPISSQGSISDLTVDSSNQSDLRKQLSSLAWVQCDNKECLKWRKISSEIAERLGDEPWTCSMNQDPNFQSCSVLEEDTAKFDRLAKKAKLDLIKSEIKRGSLVWAKMDGYCRWPALMTDDPACDTHTDGDGEEILWYHVEFLGGERSHGWVRTERVQMFGTNCHTLDSEGAKEPKSVNRNKGKKKGKFSRHKAAPKKGQLRKTYKGGNTIQKAISEALSLLPLPPVERLKTCWFVSEDKGLKDTASVAGNTKGRKKKNSQPNDQSNAQKEGKGAKKRAKISSSDLNILPKKLRGETDENQDRKKVKRQKIKDIDVMKLENKKSSLWDEQHNESLVDGSDGKFRRKRKKSSDLNRMPAGLKCLHFPSSLIGTSKEERLMLDVQMYLRNEKAFQDDVKSFMTSQGLGLSSSPVWHNVRVNIFSIFLAVYERGGFELVCENRQWSVVYSEVTHQQTSQGSSVIKSFYARNLYPYELFAIGQDYSLAVKALRQSPNKRQKASVHYDSDQPGSSTLAEQKEEDADDTSSEISEYFESLDEILKILGQEEKVDDPAQQVPDVNSISELNHHPHQHCDPMEEFVDTASGSGVRKAIEPDESAQVVPELDFPSSVESSEGSSNMQDFHEMQALQLDVDGLNDQIDFL